MRLLLTRPEPDGARTAGLLRARGHDVLLAPLMRVETIEADFGAPPFSALLLTSANAVRALDRHPRRAELLGLPVFAVGEATAQAARAAGFTDVEAADGDAVSLARLVTARMRAVAAPLLYLAGENRASDLAGVLAARGLPARMAVVYRAVPVPLSPEAAAALAAGAVDAVLHFSRRSARLYLEGAAAAGVLARALEPLHYCLAPRIAAVLAEAGAGRVVAASRPEETALLGLIGATA